MLFKNAVVFNFTKPVKKIEWYIEEINGELGGYKDLVALDQFTAPHDTQISSNGWVPAIPGGEDMVFEVNDCLFLRLRTDEKILKSSAINREVEEIARQIEERDDRKVRKAEKAEIKDTVLAKHLPNALIESRYTLGYIDLKKNWLVVDAGSFKAAEEFGSRLRKTLGTLPIRPPAMEIAPGTVLTNTLTPEVGSWITNYFEIGPECTMTGIEGAKATFKDMDLSDAEVVDHITEGQMSVSSLRLSRKDRTAFTVTDEMQIKKLKFLDGFKESVLDYDPEDEDVNAGVSYNTATWFLMTGEVRTLVTQLIEAMGGEEEDFDPLNGI